MNRNFTKEDIIKKHQTNVKSAMTAFVIAIVLGAVFVLRFLIKKNTDYFFSLTVTEVILGFSDSLLLPLLLIALYFLIYILLLAAAGKNTRFLKGCLAIYAVDTAVLLGRAAALYSQTDILVMAVDIIFHLFIIVFLSVGIYSDKKLEKLKMAE